MSTPHKTNRTATVDRQILERERARLAWSVETLAAKSGINVKTVKRLLEGKSGYWSTIRAIAAALSIPVNALTKGALTSLLPKNVFELHIRTVGIIESPEQLDKIMSATNEIVTHLQASGANIVSHDSNLTFPKDRSSCERIVLLVEGLKIRSATPDLPELCHFARPGIRPIFSPFWYFYAVKPNRLAELLQTFANRTFDPTSFDRAFGEVLAQGSDRALPTPILKLGNSLNPFIDSR